MDAVCGEFAVVWRQWLCRWALRRKGQGVDNCGPSAVRVLQIEGGLISRNHIRGGRSLELSRHDVVTGMRELILTMWPDRPSEGREQGSFRPSGS